MRRADSLRPVAALIIREFYPRPVKVIIIAQTGIKIYHNLMAVSFLGNGRRNEAANQLGIFRQLQHRAGSGKLHGDICGSDIYRAEINNLRIAAH